MVKYLLNGFSFSMPRPESGLLVWHSLTEEEFLEQTKYNNVISCIGHKDLARLLNVEYNRESITLNVGDVAYIVYLKGGRLPEGAKTLPDGVELGFNCVKILEEI